MSSAMLVNRLIKNFDKLLRNSKNNYDMIINVRDNKTFYAHSLILTSQSTYFQIALSSNWIKKDGDKIIFEKPNISSKIFDIILSHFYSGNVILDNFTPLELLDLLSAVNEFMLLELMKFAESHLLLLSDSWLKTDFVKINLHAQLFTECEKLREFCTKKIDKSPGLIFISNDFVNLSGEILMRLLSRDDLEMKEVELWKYVVQWGIHKCSNDLSEKNVKNWKEGNFNELWEVIKDYAKLIKFCNISIEDFENEVNPFSGMFPRDVYEKLLWNQIKSRDAFKLTTRRKPPPAPESLTPIYSVGPSVPSLNSNKRGRRL